MSLIMLLIGNSRLSYAELADKLNLSVNAVHKRIQMLIEAGIIHRFTAKLSLLSVNAIVAFVSGNSKLDTFRDLPERLKANDSIYWLAESSGKFLIIGAYLKKLNDFGSLVEFLKKEAGLIEPMVRIASTLPTSEHRVMSTSPQATLDSRSANIKL